LKRKFKRLPQFPTDRSPPDSLQREFPAMPGKLPGKTPHVNEICDYAGPTPLWAADQRPVQKAQWSDADGKLTE